MEVVLFEIVSWLYVLRRFAPLMDTRIFTSAGFLEVLEWSLNGWIVYLYRIIF